MIKDIIIHASPPIASDPTAPAYTLIDDDCKEVFPWNFG